jgi:branched-subunit amino acid aminotransferase/4-amino-4-deoxychorismate lyase
MPPLAFLNGAFVSPDEAAVAALDSGLQHGVGLFETMLGGIGRDAEPRIVGLGDHLERISTSARELRLSDSLRAQPLGDALLETLRRSGLVRARLRLTITGGGINLLPSSQPGPANGAETRSPPRIDPTILIVAQPATVYPEEMFARGVRVTIADARVNPLMPDEGHKTLNYWWRLRELQQAGAKGAAEALVFQVTNHLAGGCVSNAFIVKADGGRTRLLTPIARGEADSARGAVLPSPVLPGITRAAILDAAAADEDLVIERRMTTIDDVLGADEVFLTNSSWGVLPVVQVERETIGAGHAGPVTEKLRACFAAAVADELGG